MASEEEAATLSKTDLLRLSADIVSSYVGRNAVGASALEDLLSDVYQSLSRLGHAPAAAGPAPRQRPAVPVARSVQHDFIVCLEDGKKLKMLKRHLRTAYKLSPDDYRQRWGLPGDYPMVAPNYAKKRSSLAKKIGLGTKRARKRAQALAARSLRRRKRSSK